MCAYYSALYCVELTWRMMHWCVAVNTEDVDVVSVSTSDNQENFVIGKGRIIWREDTHCHQVSGVCLWDNTAVACFVDVLLSFTRSQKIWQMLGPHPLEIGSWRTPRNTFLPYVYYHTKLCFSRSNSLGVGRGSQKCLRTLGTRPFGWEHGWPCRNMLLSHLC